MTLSIFLCDYHLYLFFSEISVQIFCQLKKIALSPLLLSSESPWYTLDTSSSSQKGFANVVS